MLSNYPLARDLEREASLGLPPNELAQLRKQPLALRRELTSFALRIKRLPTVAEPDPFDPDAFARDAERIRNLPETC